MRAASRIAAILLAASALGCASQRPGPAPTDATPTATVPSFRGHVPKNLLIFSIDTFRRDHLGKYSDTELTPFLHELMDQGYTLDNHMTCADWTFAGTACTMDGRLNEENGFMPELSDSQPLPDGPQLATWLGPLGFYTIHVSGNPWFSATWNNAQGFDESQLSYGAAVSIYGAAQGVLADAIAAGSVTDRWYLHVHVMEPHAPYAPPPEYLTCEDDLPPLPGSWDLAVKDDHYDAVSDFPTLSPADQATVSAHFNCRYNGEIQYLDDQFRSIWADLEARGLLDDTLVAFWNDHGEQIWDHGYESHAHEIYAEENNGFLFFWAKNIVPGSTDLPTASIDLVPTLLALYGQTEMPPEVTGLPLGTAPADRARFGLTSARNGTISSVRKGDYKEIFNWIAGTVEVYDDATDPHETVDLYDPGDPLTTDLWSVLEPEVELAEPAILDDVPTWPADLPN